LRAKKTIFEVIKMNDMLKELFERYPALAACKDDILAAEELMMDAYKSGGKIMVCGNGGSCSDSEHIVGELMKGFLLMRHMDAATEKKFRDALGDDADEFVDKLQGGIPAISLPSQSAVLSAFVNDVDPSLMYAQLVYGYAREGDLLIAISTSGNSKNAVAAAKVAKAMGIKSLALTGERESKLSEICTNTVRVPEVETFKVQELHLPVYHYLCASVEKRIFG
jgi:D-sedoheptulose 7-phosphate isomerase